MTFMHMDASAATSESTKVSLLGGFAQDIDITYASGGFTFTSAGFSQEYEGGGSTNINTGSDWIFPRDSFTAGDFQVRGTYDSIQTNQGSFQLVNQIPEPVGTPGPWVNLSSLQQYIWVCSTTTFGPIKLIRADIRFEIRNQNFSQWNTETSTVDAAPIAADGLYSINIEAVTLN